MSTPKFVGNVKMKPDKFGKLITIPEGQVLQISLTEKDREALKETVTSTGWNNLRLYPKQNGDGWYLKIDTWEPATNGTSAPAAPVAAAAPPITAAPSVPDPADDLPF